MKLDELKIGESAIITGFEKENDSYRKKLLAFGLNEGTKINFVRKSPFSDPIVINALGTNIIIRKKEAGIMNLRSIS